jgi:hypothetical protein
MTGGWRAGASLVALLAATGCTADRIERGVFHSRKGYEVSLPGSAWQVARSSRADLELKREAPPGGMLADATCDERLAERSPERLVRHLTFGLKHRSDVHTEPVTVAGRPGARTTFRGTLDGTEVGVDAISLKGDRCVYDFLYVAPADAFDVGRADFQAFVESLALTSAGTMR